jgi:hypothetical protein
MFRITIGLATMVILVATLTVHSQTRTRRIAKGVWGGPHINLNVETDAGSIEYDCANGTIEGPLNLDSKGRFTLKGTHSPQRGGPVRRDETRTARPALYTGTVKGQTMTLNVVLTDTNENVGKFKLIFGKTG